MKSYEELARMKVQEAIQEGLQAQRVVREVRAGAGERKIHLPHFTSVLRSMWSNLPRPGARPVPESARRKASGADQQVA